MDAKKTIKRLRGETDRASSTMYVSQSILKEFREAVEPIGYSRVIEEMMREFLDDLKPKAKAQLLKKASQKKDNKFS